jgi:ribosome recycling factor
MALEDLTKKELIDLARKLDQTNKLLSNKVDTINEKAEHLPFEAVSVVSTDDKHYAVILRFDLDSGVACVTDRIEYAGNMKHMAEYEAKKIFGNLSRITNNRRKNEN